MWKYLILSNQHVIQHHLDRMLTNINNTRMKKKRLLLYNHRAISKIFFLIKFHLIFYTLTRVCIDFCTSECAELKYQFTCVYRNTIGYFSQMQRSFGSNKLSMDNWRLWKIFSFEYQHSFVIIYGCWSIKYSTRRPAVPYNWRYPLTSIS